MKLIDGRGRELSIGQRVRIEMDIPSENGMLYKDTIVKLDEFNDKSVNDGKAICMKQSWNQECHTKYLSIDRLSDIMTKI